MIPTARVMNGRTSSETPLFPFLMTFPVSRVWRRLFAETSPCRWFYFRVVGCKGQQLHLKIVNAGESSFPEAWPNYNTCVSYDGVKMFRVPTTWDEKKGVLSWKFKPEHVSC